MPPQRYRGSTAPPRRVAKGSDSGTILVFFVTLVLVVCGAQSAGIVNFSDLGSGVSISGGGSKKEGTSSNDVSRRILTEAVKYDPKPYIWASGHPPTEKSSRRGVDCSGLINVAVLEATGVNENRVAESFRRSKYWKKIKMKDAGPGDIMYDIRDPGEVTDHVVLVVDNKGSGKMTIFEARTRHGPVSEQIRYSYKQKYSRFDGALRFVMPKK